MQIIPVIDVKGGIVVAARGGDREAYRPIVTALAPDTSEPVAVTRGYRRLWPFPILYMADLDGIAGLAPNLAVVRRLADELPDMALWVDHGAATAGEVEAVLEAHPRSTVVIGSETLGEAERLVEIQRRHGERIALSLDFKGDAFLGPAALLERTQCWPRRIIVMTLAAVGRDAGPDLARVREITARAGPGRQVFAAGGVRGKADCAALAGAGASGVLVASALHAGKLEAGDLGEIAGLETMT